MGVAAADGGLQDPRRAALRDLLRRRPSLHSCTVHTPCVLYNVHTLQRACTHCTVCTPYRVHTALCAHHHHTVCPPSHAHTPSTYPGNEAQGVPADLEARDLWMKVGVPSERIPARGQTPALAGHEPVL